MSLESPPCNPGATSSSDAGHAASEAALSAGNTDQLEAPAPRQLFDFLNHRLDSFWEGPFPNERSNLRIEITPTLGPLPEMPDDVLMEVFERLPTKDLLRWPRAVCRQWRRVALHPYIWKRQSLKRSDSGLLVCPPTTAVVRAALLIAPCMDSLDLRVGDNPSITAAARETNCAVRHLSLAFCPRQGGSSEAADDVHVILERQAELGRLEKVTLEGFPAEVAGGAISAALSAPLTELFVKVRVESVGPDQGSTPATGFVACPSLRTLVYRSFGDSAEYPLLEDLIAAHAASLQSVTVIEREECFSLAKCAGPNEQLCRCPDLRVAHVPATPELDGLGACPLLTDLTLTLWGPVPDLRRFFSKAIRLEKLALLLPIAADDPDGWYQCGYGVPPWPGHDCNETSDYYNVGCYAGVEELVTELGSSGRSSLTELRVGRFEEQSSASVRRVLWSALLSGFPRLERVHVGFAPEAAILDSITPAVVPHLCLLGLDDVLWTNGKCLPPSCRYPALHELVRRYPQVHVTGVPARHECVVGACSCCPDNEHRLQLADCAFQHCNLYGHGEQEECQVDVHRHPTRCPKTDSGLKCPCSYEWRYVGVGAGGPEGDRASPDKASR